MTAGPMLRRALAAGMILAAAALAAQADSLERANGTDTFLAGTSALPAADAAGDVFATGNAVVLRGRVAGDAHATGFDVEVEAPVGGDLYAVGGTVTVRAPVGSDLTSAGVSLRTAPEARTEGNARLVGATVVVQGPVGGALTAAGGEITLDAAVAGDVWLAGRSVSFGPDARIGGRLLYSTPAQIDIPASVIPPERVTWEPFPAMAGRMWDMPGHWHDVRMPERMLPSFVTVVGGILVTLGFLLGVAALALAFARPTVERMRAGVAARPGASLLMGAAALATLLGLVPVAALSVIGLPFLPFVGLAILLAWTLAYLLGIHVVVTRLLRAFGAEDLSGMALPLAGLAAGLGVAAVLNAIPVLGWMANFALVLLGMGGLARALVARLPAADGGPPAAAA